MGLDFQTKVFGWFAKRSLTIIPLFKYLYLLILAILVFGTYKYMTDVPAQSFYYDLGKKFGQMAILLLGVIVLPGILGRLGVEIRLTRTITLFRRQLGIATFLFAVAHYTLVRGLPSLSVGMKPLANLVLFEIFGLLALTILFFMFLTSNNLSVRKLGKWWKILHRFVYIALWFLVLHTGLQKISLWTLWVGLYALLEVISWIVYFVNKKAPIQSVN